MKIAMVSEHASPLATLGGVDAGGQNVHVDALARHLVARGDEVTVFTRRDAPDLPTRLQTDAGYVVEHVPAGPPTEIPKDELWPHMRAFARYLSRRWSAEPIDIAHAHFWMSGAAAYWAATDVGVPVVQTFHALGSVKRRHQGDHDTSPPHRIDVERRLCRSVDHVIATCSDEVRELVAYGLDERRVSVVPCGVDTSLFQPRPLRRKGPHRLLVVGRLVERKGVEDVVRALRLLPGVELVIAGGPTEDSLALDPEAERLHAVARAEGTDDRLRFLGGVARARMPEVFADCDLVVATPWYEPFGIVPLEAMACGRPVVGTAVGGLLDSVVPGVTGELVTPHRPEQIADAVRDLLADPGRRARMASAGVARAREIFSWQAVAERTQAVLTQVAARHAVPTTAGTETIEVSK